MGTTKKISGMVHIQFPFKSMNDVFFEGMGAQQAQSFVNTLRDHLSRNQPEDKPEDQSGDGDDESMTAKMIKQMRQNPPDAR